MSNSNPTDIPVSRIRNVWLRRLAIVSTFPFFLFAGMALVWVSAFVAWVDFNTDLLVSARQQWRRKEK